MQIVELVFVHLHGFSWSVIVMLRNCVIDLVKMWGMKYDSRNYLRTMLGTKEFNLCNLIFRSLYIMRLLRTLKYYKLDCQMFL